MLITNINRLTFTSQNKDFDALLRKLTDKYLKTGDEEARNEIFNLVDPILKQKSQANKYYITDDIYQEKVLALFDLLENFNKEEDPVDAIKKVINAKRKLNNARITQSGVRSLDEGFTADSNYGLLNVLSEEKILKPLSNRSDEERAMFKSQIAQLNLGKHTDLVKEYFGIAAAKKTYASMAEEHNISQAYMYYKIKGSILQAQIEQGTLPLQIKEKLTKFKERMLKGTIADSELDKITHSIFIQVPYLLSLSDEEIEQNIKFIVNTFSYAGLTASDYIKSAVRHPQLFYLTPSTIEKNIRDLVSCFEDEGLTVSDYIKSALRQPQLFYQKPSTIEKNIRDLTSLFEDEGLTVSDCIKSAVKQPSLFYQKPSTVERNIRDLASRFEGEGLTVSDCIKSAVRHPQLFYQKPGTIEKNIRDLVNRFEDEGLTVSDYIKSAVRQPQLFYQKPSTIEKNIRDLTNLFEDEGLTVSDCIKSAVRQPQLFFQKPSTIEKNVREVVRYFSDYGMTANTYMPTLLKVPTLFYNSPKTIIQRIKILRFNKNCICLLNNKPLISDSEFFTNLPSSLIKSNQFFYLNLLNKLMFVPLKQKRIPNNGIKTSMEKYLKTHPNTTYNIKILDDEMTPDFIEFVKEFSESILGKNVFNIQVVKPTL